MKDLETSHSIRALLQKEFSLRRSRNPAYSLRAFAKTLQIDQSLLSKIMRSRRRVSSANCIKIGTRLGLGPDQLRSMVLPKSESSGFLSLTEDEFQYLSHWHHFAILELAKTKAFKLEPNLIAKKLGIHVEEARSALERLIRLGILREIRGRLQANAKGHSWTNLENTSVARKNLQRDLLQKSLQALEEIPFSQREHGSLTVAVDRRRIGEFKEKLKKIRQELGEFFQQDGELNEVYQLTVSFFPLTKLEEGGK